MTAKLGQLRDELDEVEFQIDELLKKVIRETGNSIPSGDDANKKALDALKKKLSGIEDKGAATINDQISNIADKMEVWEKIE